MDSMDERAPLLDPKWRKRHSTHGSNGSLVSDTVDVKVISEEIRFKRHITWYYSVAIMVGNVVGAGIFVSPVGVTANIGSVWASLIIWAVTGLYSLCQALCYAELGTTIPRAGGDYAYLYEILGPLWGFMTAWIHVCIIASSSCAVIARTAGLYLLQPLGLDCQLLIITIIALFIIVTLSAINAYSSVLATRVHTFFTIAKTLALIAIIIAGIIQMAKGNVQNFKNGFEGTNTAPGSIALAVLNGYFAFKGWELVNALPEEMTNPERDLPISVWISMVLVTVVYVLTNMAYFTVLTPAELISSGAVALEFANRALGPVAVVMPILVAMSCMGAANGDFLSNSRYIFAAGRYRHAPRVFSFMQMNWLTPLPAVMLLTVFPLLYCVITDLQQLQEYASLSVQFKMLLCLFALIYLRWKQPDIPRPYKVSYLVAIFTTVFMVALVGLSFYQSPLQSAIGLGIFVLGVPLYGLIILVRDRPTSHRIMNSTARVMQLVFKIVPETPLLDKSENPMTSERPESIGGEKDQGW